MYDKPIILYRNNMLNKTEKQIKKDENRKVNELKFRVDISLSKPEIKLILTKLYNLNIQKVNTQIKMGKYFYEKDKIMSIFIRKITKRRFQICTC